MAISIASANWNMNPSLTILFYIGYSLFFSKSFSENHNERVAQTWEFLWVKGRESWSCYQGQGCWCAAEVVGLALSCSSWLVGLPRLPMTGISDGCSCSGTGTYTWQRTNTLPLLIKIVLLSGILSLYDYGTYSKSCIKIFYYV